MTDDKSFLAALDLSASEQEAVLAALHCFPDECRSRGMFFLGMIDRIRSAKGDGAVPVALSLCGITYRISSFALHPHRDFYKLYIYAARKLYPSQPLATGLERLAESFFPIFAASLAGRTLIALLDKEPVKVLARFVDAYGIAVPWNDHAFTVSTSGVHRWTCKVEPVAFYPSVFQGICRGMVKTVTGANPVVSVAALEVEPKLHRYEFDIRLT